MRSLSAFIILQQFQPCCVLARNVAALLAQATPYIPGYFENSPEAPRPTSPPQIPRHLRQLLPRDAATCGYLVANGAANVCAESQYCTTIATGGYGVWNCCNPDSCFLETGCVDFDTCPDQYCLTSYMSITGTWLSRFMCGDSPETAYMVYRSEDTPQYTSSLQAAADASSQAAQSSYLASVSAAEAASMASQAAAYSASAASASEAAKSAAEASSRASESAEQSSQAAALASSISAAEASLSRAKASSALITVVITTTKSLVRTIETHLITATDGQVVQTIETKLEIPASTTVPGTIDVHKEGKKMSGRTIAGAAVGAGVGVALIGLVAFVLHRVRKKRREDREDDGIPHLTGVPVADKQWPHSQSGTLASSQY